MLQARMSVLKLLIQRFHPKLHSLFEQEGFEPIMYAMEWFNSLFTRTRNLDPKLRVQCIDGFFQHSWRAVYAIALAIFRFTQDALMEAYEYADDGEEFQDMKEVLLTFPQYVPNDGRALFSAEGAEYYLELVSKADLHKMEKEELERWQ